MAGSRAAAAVAAAARWEEEEEKQQHEQEQQQEQEREQKQQEQEQEQQPQPIEGFNESSRRQTSPPHRPTYLSHPPTLCGHRRLQKPKGPYVSSRRLTSLFFP